MSWWMWALLILAVMLIVSPLRKLLGALIGSLIHWLLAEGGQTIGRTILWLSKAILVSHWIFLRNLITPRSVMVPQKTGDDTKDYGG